MAAWRWWWLLSALLIAGALTLPLSNFKGHAHWSKVQWKPYGEKRIFGSDTLENVMLFLPFGFFGALSQKRTAGAIARTALLATMLSAAGEFYQVFCHNRFPSTTDICNNALGTVVGAIGVRLAQRVIQTG